MIFKNIKTKLQQTDSQNEQLARELHDTLEPINSRIKTPDSLSPEVIIEKLKNLDEKGYEKNYYIKIFPRRRIVAMAAAFAVLVSSVTVSKMLSKNDVKSILQNNKISSASDISNTPEQENTVDEDSNYPLSSSSNYIFNNGSDESQVNMLSGKNRPESIIYRMPTSAYYLDNNRLVFAPKDDDYSTLISRLSYMREIVYQDYVISALTNTPQNDVSQIENQIRYDNEAAEIDSSITASSETNNSLSYFGNAGLNNDNVDNGDIIVNDGEYIYTLSRMNKTLTIVDCRTDEMKILSQMSFGQNDILSLSNVYIYNNILSLLYIQSDDNIISTVAKFYDISDKSSPELVRTFSQEGTFASSESANGNLYIITNREVGNMYGYSDEKYESFIPATTDSNLNNGARTIVPADQIDIMNTRNSTNYVVISSIDVTSMTSTAYTYSILGNNGYIYQTADNVYIASLDYNNASLKTTLFKFSLGDIVSFETTALVNGYTLDQSSMNEYNGYFRIVTSINKNNNIYVFDQSLKKISAIENLASGETLKSVKFLGDMVYLVMDSQTEPITVIDVSIPKEPEVVGELENGEFSEYMYRINESYVIGIGYNKDVNGISDGVKIVLYNFTNEEYPIVVYSEVLGKYGSFSSIFASDEGYKNFMYDSENQIFTIPLTLTGDNKVVEFSGVCAFKINFDSENKFNEIGRITTWFPCDNNNAYIGIDGDTYSTRTVFIGNTIYLVSNNAIVSADIDDFNNNDSQLLGKKSTIISKLKVDSYKAFINSENIASPKLIGIEYSSDKHKIVID